LEAIATVRGSAMLFSAVALQSSFAAASDNGAAPINPAQANAAHLLIRKLIPITPSLHHSFIPTLHSP
jgi:hypothetical protein